MKQKNNNFAYKHNANLLYKILKNSYPVVIKRASKDAVFMQSVQESSTLRYKWGVLKNLPDNAVEDARAIVLNPKLWNILSRKWQPIRSTLGWKIYARGAWCVIVHRVTESFLTQLKALSMWCSLTSHWWGINESNNWTIPTDPEMHLKKYNIYNDIFLNPLEVGIKRNLQ